MSQFTCFFCNKTYGYKRLLQRHLDKDHFLNEAFSSDKRTNKSKTKSNFKKHLTKIHINNGSVPNSLACPYCNIKFSTKGNLQSHEKKVHSIQCYVSSRQVNRTCPFCSYTSISKTTNEINNHLNEVHKLTIREEEHSFDSIDEFSRWKDDLETRTSTVYVIRKYSAVAINYECHRKGYFTNGVNSRLKTGSCKINGHCPSDIRVKISATGSVSVFHVTTHVGHTHQSRFTHPTSLERLLASQLLQKTPHKEILKRLKNLMYSSNLKKLRLASNKNNINKDKKLQLYSDKNCQLVPTITCISPVEELPQSCKDTQLYSMDELSIGINNKDTQLYSMDEFIINIDQDTQLHSLGEFGIDIESQRQLHIVDKLSIDIDHDSQLDSIDEFSVDIDETFKMEPISEEIIVSEDNMDTGTFQMEPISKEVIISEINTDIANKKTEIKKLFDILLSKITTNEQIEFVNRCVQQLLAQVEAMQLRPSGSPIDKNSQEIGDSIFPWIRTKNNYSPLPIEI